MSHTTGYVYVIYDHRDKICKIGQTVNAGYLSNRYGTESSPFIELVMCENFGNEYARPIEKLLHAHLDNARTPQPGRSGYTEWFSISRKDADFIADIAIRFYELICTLNDERKINKLFAEAHARVKKINVQVQYG